MFSFMNVGPSVRAASSARENAEKGQRRKTSLKTKGGAGICGSKWAGILEPMIIKIKMSGFTRLKGFPHSIVNETIFAYTICNVETLATSEIAFSVKIAVRALNKC